jgi:hypothetical protein
MFKGRPSEPPTLAETLGIDLDFRPRDYFWARDHDLALPSDIAGHERREMVKRLIADGEEVPDGLDASRLEPELREAWGAMHPMNMGGEYLPPMFDGEVEIARISLRSVTGDQISVRARRNGDRIRYRIVDEYPENGETYIPHPRTSTCRLTLGELVTMIDEATDEGGVAIGALACNLDMASDPRDLEDFVTVESDFYPDLGRYYAEIFRRLVAAAVSAEAEAQDGDE